MYDEKRSPLPRVPALAKALDVHPATIYRAAPNGEIHTVRVGKSVRIPWSEYYRLIGEGMPGATGAGGGGDETT